MLEIIEELAHIVVTIHPPVLSHSLGLPVHPFADVVVATEADPLADAMFLALGPTTDKKLAIRPPKGTLAVRLGVPHSAMVDGSGLQDGVGDAGLVHDHLSRGVDDYPAVGRQAVMVEFAIKDLIFLELQEKIGSEHEGNIVLLKELLEEKWDLLVVGFAVKERLDLEGELDGVGGGDRVASGNILKLEANELEGFGVLLNAGVIILP